MRVWGLEGSRTCFSCCLAKSDYAQGTSIMATLKAEPVHHERQSKRNMDVAMMDDTCAKSRPVEWSQSTYAAK